MAEWKALVIALEMVLVVIGFQEGKIGKGQILMGFIVTRLMGRCRRI